MGVKYVLPFRFRDENGKRTSHHLIFVSKSFRGYAIMKEIMAKESSRADQGVPSLEYSPADERFPMLFSLTRPVEALADDLRQKFAGKTLLMKQIYEAHNMGTPYIASNYKDALLRLESEKRIIAIPPVDKRPKRKGALTFGDRTVVS